MRINFDLDDIGADQRRVASQFDQYLQTLPEVSGNYRRVSSISTADVVIGIGRGALDGRDLVDILRPLTKRDVQKIVWDVGDRPTGRFSGFYCSLPRFLFDSRRHRTMCYHLPFNELVDEFARSDAQFDFGMIGGATATVRSKIFSMFGNQGLTGNWLVKCQTSNWQDMFSGKSDPHKLEYATHLRETKFVLCPRGYGVGSARFFETLQAGRVPVLISDQYVLPSGIDWNSCLLRVKENDIETIPNVVEANLSRWPDMALAARKVWQDNFSGQAILRTMGQNAEQILQQADRYPTASRAWYCGSRAVAYGKERMRPLAGRVKRKLFRSQR